jgi:hypothetical protein
MFLSFFFHSFSHSLFLPLSLSLLIFNFFCHSNSLSSRSTWTRVSVRADPQMLRERGCTRFRAYISLVCVLLFCSFSLLPLVGVVGFAWQRPFRLAKGEGVTSILKGIPLCFLQSKNSRVVFTFLMLVYRLCRCLCEDFQTLPQKKSKTVSGNLQVSWLLRGMVWAI